MPKICALPEHLKGGYNLPPGVSASDPSTPWNNYDPNAPDLDIYRDAWNTARDLKELLESCNIYFELGSLIDALESLKEGGD